MYLFPKHDSTCRKFGDVQLIMFLKNILGEKAKRFLKCRRFFRPAKDESHGSSPCSLLCWETPWSCSVAHLAVI
jgi:hypothetical protein